VTLGCALTGFAAGATPCFPGNVTAAFGAFGVTAGAFAARTFRVTAAPSTPEVVAGAAGAADVTAPCGVTAAVTEAVSDCCPGAFPLLPGEVGVVVVFAVDVLAQPVCAGLPFAMPLFVSHSYPAFVSEAFGIWPGGFLLSALPTQPAHGLPPALPPPLPF